MSWRNAPLYVESHDLAVWLTARAEGWRGPGAGWLGPRIAAEALKLVEEVALALTFPARRAAHLERADAAIVVLRTDLRLAEELDVLPARGLRFACDRLREIGRMVGGWRKQVEKREARRPRGRQQGSGDGPSAAGSV